MIHISYSRPANRRMKEMRPNEQRGSAARSPQSRAGGHARRIHAPARNSRDYTNGKHLQEEES